jgi:hypothetical protein
MRVKGELPGRYTCVVMPNKRNTFPLQLHLLTDLRRVLRRLGRQLVPTFDLESDTPCHQMIAGVLLNGRKYKQGDRCEYLPRVVRHHGSHGIGGDLGGSMSHLIGTIKMFYHFDINGQRTTFVDILDHPILRKDRSMYIIAYTPQLLMGRSAHPVTAASTIYHIDAITSKVLLAPHYTPELKHREMCAITMWEAR